ncbi:MAG: hypothetical protein Q4B06_00215 [Candidatus Saccharibacteria bacterium]|nr:hypothetical protein [Candidatus Saccharibacteria bacterium]
MEKQKRSNAESAVFKVLIAVTVLIVVQVAVVFGATYYAQQGDMKLEAEMLQLRKEVSELKAAQ